MEKRGVDENEQIKIAEKIEELRAHFSEEEGLTKTASEDVTVNVTDWDEDNVYFAVRLAGILQYKIHFSRNEFQ